MVVIAKDKKKAVAKDKKKDAVSKKSVTRYVADFETTTYEGQESTEVWAAAIVKEGSDDVEVFSSIEDFWKHLMGLPGDSMVYFHNLPFDGEFILSYVLDRTDYVQAFAKTNDPFFDEFESYGLTSRKAMPKKSINYLIAKKGGQWYRILMRNENGRYIEFRDSYNLIPVSVEEIGKSLITGRKKLSIEYKGVRAAGGAISDKEAGYIKNDVLIVKEALELMWKDGHDKLTIGACCMADFLKMYKEQERLNHTPEAKIDFNKRYHNLVYYKLDDADGIREPIWGALNADEYIRKAYHGGWCYVNPHWARKVVDEGVTLDVCSLYPSAMHSSSGSRYPWGEPHFWKGDIPEHVKQDDSLYYFVRFRTKFILKPGMLPFVSIKGNPMYRDHEILESSYPRNPRTGGEVGGVTFPDGSSQPAVVEMTMSCTDWVLFQEHYDLEDLEILDGCWFYTTVGLFDAYIEKWMEVKKKSTGAMRLIAKLFLNNLYGKMAASMRSDFRIARLGEDGVLRYDVCYANDKTPGYIPIGAAITSYARAITVRAAQENYHGDLPGFLYADTDSMHLNIPLEKVKGVKIDPVELNHWKVEAEWKQGKFVRAKTYIEELTDGTWNIKCAGMSKASKELFIEGLSDGEHARPVSELSEAERNFLYTKKGKKRKYTINDFDYGLRIPGSLKRKRIQGGVVLLDEEYTLKQDVWFRCPD